VKPICTVLIAIALQAAFSAAALSQSLPNYEIREFNTPSDGASGGKTILTFEAIVIDRIANAFWFCTAYIENGTNALFGNSHCEKRRQGTAPGSEPTPVLKGLVTPIQRFPGPLAHNSIGDSVYWLIDPNSGDVHICNIGSGTYCYAIPHN